MSLRLSGRFASSRPWPYGRRRASRKIPQGRAVNGFGGNGVAKRTAVVIVDHGSRRQDANALLHSVVETFRQRTHISVVLPAHLEILKPDIADALSSSPSLRCLGSDSVLGSCVDQGAEHVVLSPFFLSPGRHTQEDIPQLVERAIAEHSLPISYSIAEPIGTDPLVVEILQRRVSTSLDRDSELCNRGT